MQRVPTVVSIDATPAQIDELGDYYQHRQQPGPIESAKHRLHTRCFDQATALVTWSAWAANSLVDHYGVDRNKITVIPPGVVPEQWHRDQPRIDRGGPVRILFVGGDFQRKGGDLLVEAVEQLRSDPEVISRGQEIELHLVTSPAAKVEPAPHRHVHHGLTPNSPELIELFHHCDVFALPTRGDCTPVVLAEAASAGLPAVATDVGAVAESVVDEVTGHIVDQSAESVAAGLRPLVLDRAHRLELGANAVRHAARRMDSDQNARQLLDVAVRAASEQARRRRVVLTVSGIVPTELQETIDAGLRPLADYKAIANASGAELLDWAAARSQATRGSEFIRRFAGNSVALAYHLYRRRHDYDVVITDGEQVGLPLAALLRLRGQKPFRHVMIGHRLTPSKKVWPVRLLGLQKAVDEFLLYSSHQLDRCRELYGVPSERLRRIDFMVDTHFFQPTRTIEAGPVGDRPLICAAGREFRDYPTFIEAVRDLDADVIIASASPWSKRADNAQTVAQPANVTVTSMNQRELRDLLDECDLLVMPLIDTDFQAGITTILEAMAMERPVVCTATVGQTDVLSDDVNGLFVPPGDVVGLRRAIEELLADPSRSAAMGKRGRRLVEQRADVRHYGRLFAEIADSHLPDRGPALREAKVTSLPSVRLTRQAPSHSSTSRQASC